MNDNYSIRAYQKGDEKGIIELFSIVFGQQIDFNFWSWKFNHLNTVYSFVIESKIENKIVGHVGAMPLEGVYKNRNIPCFQMCDVMIHPDIRGGMGSKNLFNQIFKLTIESILVQHSNAFCFGFPGNRPFLLGKKSGIYGKIEQAVISEFPSYYSRFRFLQLRQLSWDDKRLNALWEQHSQQYNLAIKRDKPYLNWRYASHPTHNYHMVGLYFLGQLKGWAVVQNKVASLHIIDLLINKFWLKQALKTLSSYAAKLKLNSVYTWLPNGWRETQAQQTESDVVAMNVIWKTAIDTKEVSDNFFYTMGDLDIF